MNPPIFELNIITKKWIEPEQHDLCAHGSLKVKIGTEVIVDETDDDGWTISSTALLLLRTLSRNHTIDNPLGDFLIPCCGHYFVYEDDMDEVYVASCPSGFDWQVIHENDSVKLITESGNKTKINFEDYKRQVLNFVDQVEKFYEESSDKEISEDETIEKGYLQFWKEWKDHRIRWR